MLLYITPSKILYKSQGALAPMEHVSGSYISSAFIPCVTDLTILTQKALTPIITLQSGTHLEYTLVRTLNYSYVYSLWVIGV